MKSVNEIEEPIVEKLFNSYKYNLKNARLNANELHEYYNSQVNHHQLLTEKIYNLRIIDDSKYEVLKPICFNYETNEYTLNMHYIVVDFYKKHQGEEQISIYELNILLLEYINKIIASVELRRGINNNILYKKESEFYTYLVNEYIDPSIKSIVRTNYNNIRKMQLTSHIIDKCTMEYGLNPFAKLNYVQKINKYIYKKFFNNEYECPSMNAKENETTFFKMSDKGYFIDINRNKMKQTLGNDVPSKFEYAVNHQMKQKPLPDQNLLDALLYGKMINNDVKNIILKDVINNMSIIDYAEGTTPSNNNILAK